MTQAPTNQNARQPVGTPGAEGRPRASLIISLEYNDLLLYDTNLFIKIVWNNYIISLKYKKKKHR